MANPRGRPKKQELMENDSQTQELRRLVQQRRSHRALAFRAKIILQCASGKSNVAIAQQLKTTGFTAGFWRQRFMVGGVENLFDEPRPGAPRKIGDEDVESVVELTLESTPKAAAHWSTRVLAEKTGLSQSAISRIWRALGLHPPARPGLSALRRCIFGGESARHRGVRYEPARPRVGALRGREKSNAGLKSHAARPADATGTGGA